MKPKIDIVIPTHNGLPLLRKHLPATIKNSPEISSVIVIDNGSADGTPEYLKKFSNIKLIQNATNLGFTSAINQGVDASNADLVVLLNNDVSPHQNYLKSALSFFKDMNVFAVTFSEENSSWPQVHWKNGKIQYTNGVDREHPRLSLWASGGSSILRRSIWNELGGFNEIYNPGYQEDIDLGWRAYQQGYKIVWDPASKVSHQHETSFSKLNHKFVNFLKQRNELLFHWLNISDTILKAEHLKFLITYSLSHPGYFKIIIGALKTYKNSNRISSNKLSDLEILAKVNEIYQS